MKDEEGLEEEVKADGGPDILSMRDPRQELIDISNEKLKAMKRPVFNQ